MKKLSLLIVAVLFCAITINAQDDNSSSTKPVFGAKLGYSSITLKVIVEDESESEDISGFSLGIFGDFNLSEKFDLRGELNYSAYSEDGESTGVLQLPVLLKYNIDERFSLLAGPQVDFLMDEDDAAGLHRVGVGIALGLAFDITDELFFDARYSFGINDRLSGGLEGFEEFDIKTYFNYLHVGIGYRFN